MKEFSLEEHLKNPNREVVTRSGMPVRIICTDRKNHSVGYPIVALVENDEDNESIESYTTDGNWWGKGRKGNFDLFFAPEKKVGWMNLYRKYFGLVQSGEVYNSEEAAKKIAAGDEDYITTIKVEWED